MAGHLTGTASLTPAPHPNPGKATIGQRLHRLEVHPETSPITLRIFQEYASGRGLYAIAESLTREGIPSPSAHDRERNPHRCGLAWSKQAVRAILANPRYTGRQVWNRQRRDEVLIDVDDVALVHESRMRWNEESAWVWSDAKSHDPIVSVKLFEQVQAQLRQGARRRFDRKARKSDRPYAPKGLVRCGICQRRMEGTGTTNAPTTAAGSSTSTRPRTASSIPAASTSARTPSSRRSTAA